MKISNELKVGLTIIIATTVFILGIRYFEDLPLFKTTYDLSAEFDNAGGLIPGNLVRVNGVTVGGVNDVQISRELGKVLVKFHVNRDISVTEGSYVFVSGIDALGAVRLDMILGSADAPLIPEGGRVTVNTETGLLGGLSAKAPGMIDQFSHVLEGLDTVLSEAGTMLSEPGSDLRKTLRSVESSVSELESMLAAERGRVSSILLNVEEATGSINTLASTNGPAITQLIADLNKTITSLDGEIESLGKASRNLDLMLTKINEGQGTIGLLVNDPSMYHKMDSTLNSLNLLMTDFKANPGKYLGEMKLVDIF